MNGFQNRDCKQETNSHFTWWIFLRIQRRADTRTDTGIVVSEWEIKQMSGLSYKHKKTSTLKVEVCGASRG
jgi:hypothetical protein